ncbi:pyridine nucleotide-disulfide oxidoreductase [Hirsutella rhossiliensis]|uniref:Pyridine nucleotide-disulfide oxidoreductase domain-containing protein n=1 Tax=Hirsutella rhossiliensis TaxID=111463 RepID=A0A9P8MV52_9HYPO|nr:pyridine nucleotide-disulfide oxidoreductase domain-containing protein [Hirsutella rhossiliensis]KAH0962753.1 pyridine nucleotide-disulfide oxidoreductase domain-containing protein [Hirsutella rhossiliensis]
MAGAPDLATIASRYQAEKNKRLRPDGDAQYLELGLSPSSSRLAGLAQDPWADHDALDARPPGLADGDDVRVLVLGAGYGGLVHAVRIVEAGFAPADVRIVDPAGGFGGTWYWNRYPGLMCDVESAMYMPLLEETGHVPAHRFSYGPELRRHAEAVAARWRLADQAVFRTRARSLAWDHDAGRWSVVLRQVRGRSGREVDVAVRAQFVVLAGGVLNHPKAPQVPGIDDFAGPMMHTGRWDYAVSGGSPDDWTLAGLAGKRVGVVGTGATAVQLVPELAKWAGRLVVFQRTPSAVDERGQRETDTEAWRAMTARPGWQKARIDNWNGLISGYPIDENLRVPDVVAEAHAPRMERLRTRVDQVVTKDRAAAEALKAWYPSWCKRPCFHDDYLEAFNLDHVSLVDTSAAKGIERFTRAGIVAAGREYELDIIVLATGFRSPAVAMVEPSSRSNTTVTGRGGVELARKWHDDGASTLHGMLTHGFPNLILTGPAQAGASGNYAGVQDVLARHAAHVLSEAVARAERDGVDGGRVTVEATEQAEADWTARIVRRATWMAPVAVCGPGYINNESDAAHRSPDEAAKGARASPYPLGIIEYERVLERWRREGSMQGLTVGSSGGGCG